MFWADSGPDLFVRHCVNNYLFLIFILVLSPLPPGVPGEGPDCHFPQDIGGLGPIPARIRGVIYL